MKPFLSPIEKPKRMLMKVVYAMSRMQFGRVLTPLKVFCARMPLGFSLFYGKIAQLDRKLLLAPETILLVREQVARINLCRFCIDIGRSFTIKASMDEAKFDALEQFGSSPLFSEAERAALDYATELTRSKTLSAESFGRLSAHYSDREICEIAWLVASEHFYNMIHLGLNIDSDMLCEIARKST